TGLGLAASDLYAWTDARVVLAWLRSHPSRWKPFVANRVAAVQELVPADRWKHVPTKENPADPATRGVTPAELSELRLWWRGPGRLEGPADSWPNEAPVEREEGEERRVVAAVTAAQDPENELLVRFSSFSRLIRVTAYCARFLRDGSRPGTAHLSTGELEKCRLRWLRIAQQLDYARD
ncbi:zinc knuckle protein, partial [Lasius niger]